MPKSSVAAIILNWNDADLLPKSVGSLLDQSEKCDVVVVDNGSIDNSKETIKSFGDKVVALWNENNQGFAGGVNTGIRYALKNNYKYIALLNNDAVADRVWIKHLVDELRKEPKLGSVTSSLLHKGRGVYDSTGDFYTIWGLPYPRGRKEKASGQYDDQPYVTAVSGGASMFRREFFEDIGLYDEDFFAYYEDVDLGLRGQLKGWKSKFVPKAIVHHETGSTSSRVKGFNTYQTFKNLPWVIYKNVPLKLLPSVLIRFKLAYLGFFISAARRNQLRYAIKGILVSMIFLPKKIWQRVGIQSTRKITTEEFSKLLVQDLPPNADKLRKIRAKYWRIRGKKL